MKLKKNNGFTLMDALLWFAVFGVLIAVLYGKFSTGMADGKTKNEIDATSQAAATLKSIMQSANVSSATALNQTAINAGAIVKPWMINGSSITNSWAGTVDIQNKDVQSFTISSGSVPKAACIDILTSPSDYFSQTVNSNSSSAKTSVTAVSASTSCSTDSNTVVLTYQK